MSLASSVSVLLISLIRLVSGEQFLNLTFLLVLFASAPTAAVLLTVIVSLTWIYASL